VGLPSYDGSAAGGWNREGGRAEAVKRGQDEVDAPRQAESFREMVTAFIEFDEAHREIRDDVHRIR
jgi:hypothetical protein